MRTAEQLCTRANKSHALPLAFCLFLSNLSLIYRGAIGNPDRRHLFVTPCMYNLHISKPRGQPAQPKPCNKAIHSKDISWKPLTVFGNEQWRESLNSWDEKGSFLKYHAVTWYTCSSHVAFLANSFNTSRLWPRCAHPFFRLVYQSFPNLNICKYA